MSRGRASQITENLIPAHIITESHDSTANAFSHLLNGNINESSLSNLWVFKNDLVQPPVRTNTLCSIDSINSIGSIGSIGSNKISPIGIEYRRAEDAHHFLIDPKHIQGPIIFLHCLDIDKQRLSPGIRKDFDTNKDFRPDANKNFSPSKTIITISEGSCTLIECYVHENHFSETAVTETEIILKEKSEFKHLQLLKGFCKSQHTLNSRVTQQSNSIYQGGVFSFDLSNQTIIDLNLQGTQAKTSFHALMALKDTQKAKLFLTTVHHQPDCESRMMVRGLANDSAQGAFVGKIIVQQDAIDSKAWLENKNLLLSDQAEMVTGPLLEVYNDNIQCSHGATVGQLDEDAVFYLKSRGIPEHSAKKMLISAFIQPILEDVPPVVLAYLQECIHEY